MEKFDIYKKVTERILEKLEQGKIPWHKPWDNKGLPSSMTGNLPANFKTKRTYRGINVLLLALSGYSCRYWLTYKQAEELKCSVKKGEKGTPIVFWSQMTVEDKETGEEKKKFFLKGFTVFNLEQTTFDLSLLDEGKEKPKEEEKIPVNEVCESIIANYKDKPIIKIIGDRACYSPSADQVYMPRIEMFDTPDHYYATMFHELGHSTGHESRLNRPEVVNPTLFGSHAYSKEELVAEMTSGFLCAIAGIDTDQVFNNSVAYLQSWIKVLKNSDNKKLLVNASSQAQKAVDLILGINKDEQNEEGE